MTKSFSDVLIVGGGPAGLSTAIALSNKGITSTIVDFNKPPVDKPCGEGLMPDSLKALSKLGISISEDLGFSFSGIRFRRGDCNVEADFPVGEGLGIRRTVLHRALVENAQSRNEINFQWRRNAKLSKPGVVLVGDQEVQYKWLVAADGQNSSLRKQIGLDEPATLTLRYGFRQHFNVSPWTRRMEIYWSDVGQMYVTPTNKNELCVVYLSRERGLNFEEALRDFPALHSRLKQSPPSSKRQGAITATRLLKHIYKDNVALIGDASGSVDAITGEGLALSFRQALILAEAIEKEDLAIYGQSHAELLSLPLKMAKLMLTLDRCPHLQTRIFKALQSTPSTFGKLLATHVGHRSLPLTLLEEGPKVAWHFLFPTEQALPTLSTAELADVRYLSKDGLIDLEEVCQIA